jgi:hypothetical protein
MKRTEIELAHRGTMSEDITLFRFPREFRSGLLGLTGLPPLGKGPAA